MAQRGDRLVRAVVEVLRHAGIGRHQKMAIGVSGGIDSMVLLDVLGHLVAERVVVHCDHGLRAESIADAQFVEDQAAQRGCRYVGQRCEVAALARQNGISIEEAGRRARYALYAQVAADEGAAIVALGHHRDDQAETVLMHLLRGSGSGGLRGMQVLRDGMYLRPLLEISRAEIVAYAQENDVPFREDASNADGRFLRNRVRGHLLPILREYNPNVVDVLHRTAAILNGENDFVEAAAENALTAVLIKGCGGKLDLDVPRLVDYHIAVQRRVIRLVLGRLSAVPADFALIDRILQTVRERREGLLDVGRGLRIQYWRDRLLLRQGGAAPLALPVPLPGAVAIPERGGHLSCRLMSAEDFGDIRSQLGHSLVALDADKLGAHPLVRTARVGDRFQPFGMRGKKKLSDFLIDLKYPRILRDEVLVLEGNGHIAWVVGMRCSEAFRIGPESRRIAVFEFRSSE